MSHRIVCSLAFVASLAAASSRVARAAPVVFDNTDRQFVWRSSGNELGPLYVTRGPGDQPPVGTTLPLPVVSGAAGGGHSGGSAFLSGSGSGLGFAWEPPPGGIRLLSPADEVGPAMGFGDLLVTASYGRAGNYVFPGGLVGISFPLNGGVHYGFMELTGINGLYPQPLRWGYESEAGVPFPISVVVPEPAGLCLLSAAAGLVLRRRRHGPGRTVGRA